MTTVNFTEDEAKALIDLLNEFTPGNPINRAINIIRSKTNANYTYWQDLADRIEQANDTSNQEVVEQPQQEIVPSNFNNRTDEIGSAEHNSGSDSESTAEIGPLEPFVSTGCAALSGSITISPPLTAVPVTNQKSQRQRRK